MYSIEFQRLVGVTQVVSPTERFPVHNRLTHSLKVAQVGRSIAEQLLSKYPQIGLDGRLDPDVVDAACLAHDIGHPPFGHNTERELDVLLAPTGEDEIQVGDGFEGNAQSFRVVTSTAIRYQERAGVPGLNLTAATLNAIQKYPWPHSDPNNKARKWGYYQSERQSFEFARQACGFTLENPVRSFEANVMNLADDISYAVHDVEDFVRAGLIPTEVLIEGSNEQAWFLDRCAEYDTLLDPVVISRVLKLVNLDRYRGTHGDIALLSEFRSESVNRFISSLSVQHTSSGAELSIPPEIQIEITVLKALTRAYVIDSPTVQGQRYGQRRMIHDIFTIYLNEATIPDSTRAPRAISLRIFAALWKDRLMQIPVEHVDAIKRVLADLISAMTEQQVVDTYEKLTGYSHGSVTDPIG